jgi:hypothetical protein
MPPIVADSHPIEKKSAQAAFATCLERATLDSGNLNANVVASEELQITD